jgi:transcription initiation factor TFIIIB Brf1 subunit/transcription initiation factor TFIIB
VAVCTFPLQVTNKDNTLAKILSTFSTTSIGLYANLPIEIYQARKCSRRKFFSDVSDKDSATIKSPTRNDQQRLNTKEF